MGPSPGPAKADVLGKNRMSAQDKNGSWNFSNFRGILFKWSHDSGISLAPELTAHCQEACISSCAARRLRGCPDLPVRRRLLEREVLWIYYLASTRFVLHTGLKIKILPEDRFLHSKVWKPEAWRIKSQCLSASAGPALPDLALTDLVGLLWFQKLQFSEYFLALLHLCLLIVNPHVFQGIDQVSFSLWIFPSSTPSPNQSRSLPPLLKHSRHTVLWLSCHWAMSIPKIKHVLLPLCSFSIQNGPGT